MKSSAKLKRASLRYRPDLSGDLTQGGKFYVESASPSSTEAIAVFEANVVKNTFVEPLSRFYYEAKSTEGALINIESSNPLDIIDGARFLPASAGSRVVNLTINRGSFSKAYHIPLTVPPDSTGTVISFSDFQFIEDSFATHVDISVRSRLSTYNANQMAIYSIRDHNSQNYILNPDCWASNLDFSGVSVWNSTGGDTRAGTLISPRDIVFATHYQINVGATLRFRGSDGIIYTRTLTHKSLSIDGVLNDCHIGTLNADLPSSVKWYKVLPKTYWSNKFRYNASNQKIGYYDNNSRRYTTFGPLCILLNRKKEAVVGQIDSLVSSFTHTKPFDEKNLWWRQLIVGDSGNPAFFVAGNELVLLGTHFTAGSGPHLASSSEAVANYNGLPTNSIFDTFNGINEKLIAHGSPYQLTEIDLSDFPSY